MLHAAKTSLAAALLLSGVAVLGSRGPAQAFRSFEEVQRRPSISEDGTGDIDGDGSGNWIMVAVTPWAPSDISYRLSTDDAANWGPLIGLDDEATTGTGAHEQPIVATEDGSAWITVYRFQNGSFGTDLDLFARRSVDGGASFLSATAVEADAAVDSTDEYPYDLVVRGGTWLLAYCSYVGVGDATLNVVRSSDAGATWSAPVEISTSTPSCTYSDHHDARLESDGAGNWVLAWNAGGQALGLGIDSDILFSRSTDDGLTWTPAAALNVGADTDSRGDSQVDLAHDGSAWLAVWSSSNDLGGIGNDTDLVFAHSYDGGATWTAPSPLNSNAASDGATDIFPIVRHDGDSTLVVAWTSDAIAKQTGGDYDLFLSFSEDGGLSWSPLSLLNHDAPFDHKEIALEAPPRDYLFEVERAGDTWVAAWRKNSALYVARSVVDCPAVPETGCHGSINPGDSRIKLRQADVSNDTLVWNLKRSDEVLLTELGDPLATSDYVMCLYDQDADTPRLVFEKDARAGGTCSSKPCWKTAGSTGFGYKDGKQRQGAMQQVKIKAGDSGKGQVRIKARGLAVVPPILPLANDSSVIAQLVNLETGACWEASFSAPDRNDESRYQARSD